MHDVISLRTETVSSKYGKPDHERLVDRHLNGSSTLKSEELSKLVKSQHLLSSLQLNFLVTVGMPAGSLLILSFHLEIVGGNAPSSDAEAKITHMDCRQAISSFVFGKEAVRFGHPKSLELFYG